MLSLRRQCRLLLEPNRWLVLVLVMQVYISVRTCLYATTGSLIFNGVDPSPFITNLRLVQGLTVAYCVWSVLVHRRLVAAATGKGLVLASFGIHCRLMTDVILYGAYLTGVYDDGPLGRPFTDLSFPGAEDMRVLHSLLHHGGLLAYVIGFALVLFGALTDTRQRSLAPYHAIPPLRI